MSPAHHGFFVTLEGGEGAGKSTLAFALEEHYRSNGREVIRTREPGGSPGAEDIRALVVSGASGRWDALTETLLITAARRDHVERVIRPALSRGALVFCDRYIDSTLAYQGAGRGVPVADIRLLHDRCVGLMPDLTLLLDVPPGIGLRRAASRGGAARFESFDRAFHETLRAAYLDLAQAEPARITVLDAQLEAGALQSRALAALGGAPGRRA